ncbi:DNA-binding response regulator [Aquibium sp. A9E412]|uniref:DNA-binding response regulator n=1 Tax=Aquibium sp. A9E412 TaxID=2976767 RepID=UPI0025AF2196|nr:DNA-binding response regulator [Aquibium sp. A9E412]MDN2567573.1 DNA-binding response regulator [Aquibium sp. A9E412]
MTLPAHSISLPDTTVVVVAPDEAFRRSLGFVLEAEGYRIRLFDHLPAAGVWVDGACCAVVDEKALEVDGVPLARLTEGGRPVVLLVDRIKNGPAAAGLSLVEKPLLGRTLVDAVSASLPGHAGRPRTT